MQLVVAKKRSLDDGPGDHKAGPSQKRPAYVPPESTDDAAEFDDDLLCPITGDVMQDPVMETSSGEFHSYERSAIMHHLEVNGEVHPQTRGVLKMTDLVPDRKTKNRIEACRKKAREKRKAPYLTCIPSFVPRAK